MLDKYIYILNFCTGRVLRVYFIWFGMFNYNFALFFHSTISDRGRVVLCLNFGTILIFVVAAINTVGGWRAGAHLLLQRGRGVLPP